MDSNPEVTAIIPAFNEANNIRATIASLQAQTLPLTQIMVVDDCSTDETAVVAESCGVTVLRLDVNSGKAVAHNRGIAAASTACILTVDADTCLAPDALAHLVPFLDDPQVGVVCARVLPSGLETMWERGRFIEYILGQAIYKQGQHRVRSVLVAAGCCALYRRSVLQRVGGFRNVTMTEDMDMAWMLFARGYTTAFASKAHCTAMEPTTLSMYLLQLDRWYRGMLQCLALHPFHSVQRLKLLTYWYVTDALLTPLWLFLVLCWGTEAPLESLGLAFLADVGISGLVAMCAEPRRILDVFRCLPAYMVVRQLNMLAYFRALCRERLQGKKLTLWEKGH